MGRLGAQERSSDGFKGSDRRACDGVRGAWKTSTSGKAREATSVTRMAFDGLLVEKADAGVMLPEARGVCVCDQGGGFAASCGSPGVQRIDSGGSSMGSDELMRCFGRDAARATSSSVSESRRLTEWRPAQNPEFSLHASSDSVAITTFNLEPNRFKSHLVGCCRATKDGGTVKSYQPEELDWSTDATLAAQREDTEIKDVCHWMEISPEPPVLENVLPLSGTVRTYL